MKTKLHKVLHGEILTEENFSQPPLELGILPFWFWNGELNEHELEWQMREYRDKGIPGLFIHGRFGLKVPYLSEDWFERVKFVVEKAKEIGIDIWVYDEMNWPSGTADRQVLKKYPYLSQKYLELVILNLNGPIFTFLEASDSRYVNTGDSKPIAAFACKGEEFETGINNLIDLTANLSFEKVISWEAPKGNWKILYFLEKEANYYIDTLNPESTERFIELTHEKYKNAVGKDFGQTVPGFYTDEPAMYYYQVGVDNFVIPWTKQMFKIFRQRRGYNLRPFLPALFANMGEKTFQIRYDFWRTLTEQYAETYYKRIRDWCDENKAIFTGHLLFEEWLRGHARCEGNIFKYLKYMHLIGVDHLYPKIGSEKEPAEHVALKIGSSAAHHFGSARLLCESMGGSYWDCTLERMKWIANWEYVLGVNLFNNHGYHYSIEGERKRDWPPSQFYHHTWWKYYYFFTTYMSRLGHILSGGKHVAKILVLYPINSIWTNYVPQKRTDVGTVIEEDFNYLTDALLRLHYDFDYVDEDVLLEAIIEDGKIKIADEEYSVFILPPVTHIKRSTFERMKDFVAGGGSVIADTLLPIEFLESNENEAVEEITAFFKANSNELLQQFRKDGEFYVTTGNDQDTVFLIRGKGLHHLKSKETLKQILDECLIPDITIDNPEVFYLHRVKDGFDIYFLVNTSQKDQGLIEITFEQTGRPELWNPVTGDISPIHVWQIKNGRLAIRLNFSACESHIVVIKNEKTDPVITESNIDIVEFKYGKIIGFADNVDRANVTVQSASGSQKLFADAKPSLPRLKLGKALKFKIEDDNILCLSKWKMAISNNAEDEKDVYKINDEHKNWIDVTMGAWEMQLPIERDEETYPVSLWYHTTFDILEMPSNTRLLIDGFSGSEYRIFVNEKKVKDKGKRSKLDAEIKEVDIQEFLCEGTNGIVVNLIVTRRTDGILDLLKIVGDFALQKSGESYAIIKNKNMLQIGDWTQQGYPFYSGTGVYETEINLPDEYLDGRLTLEVDCGDDVLEVIVNDSPSRVVPWHPYKIDVSDLVKSGNNNFKLKVTNTLINMLEGVQKPSGIFREPQMKHEHKYVLSW